ncbi:MAG: ATP synthase subunit delta [Flavobacteriaceae bacterium]|nr:MAG: ATP synthase subunit delta [Flavobacteriaceae bacterium]|tara:strand:- start:11703 stop:12239 length:537 start_codon:yes stop_codon:yes gene_type:complete
MIQNRAAIRYAKAILEFALEQKAEEAVQRDFEQVTATLEQSKDLAKLLESPVMEASEKKEVLGKIFSNQAPATQKAMALLAKNQRINLLGQVAQEYQKRIDALQGVQKAQVTTAAPLEKALEKEVLGMAQKLTPQKVILENKIDPTLLGGFVLQIGDLQYNASVAQQLRTLKQELTEK